MPFLRKTAIWCKRYMRYLYGQASQENAIRICPADLLVPNDQPIRLPCPSAHSLSPSLIYHFAICLPTLFSSPSILQGGKEVTRKKDDNYRGLCW
jgi:hypothetical protein